MKKIFLKNLSLIVIASFIISISFFIIAAYSRADDDREDNEDDFRQSNEENFQQPIEVIQPQPIITQTPVIAPSASSPVSDNSAILAALNDSDKDGVPDIIDKYPGQDDFAYYLLDRNKNGIADDLENLIK